MLVVVMMVMMVVVMVMRMVMRMVVIAGEVMIAGHDSWW